MGLKNLVVQKAALTEDAIEDIVADYVGYDTDETEVAFTPKFGKLNNRAKVLVYLVALQGWPFVSKEVVETSAKPAEIGDATGIPGGTLRPILKQLKDGHFISVKNGAYSVRASHLQSVKSEIIESPTGESTRPPKRRAKKKSADNKSNDLERKKTGKKNAGLAETINKWIDEGFFDDGRSTADVRDRFHEETIIVAHSSIPGYVNSAVKAGKLGRKKEEVDGKQVWVYRTKKQP